MSSASVQIVVDHRHMLNQVRDQGRRPTCLSMSVTTAHEIYLSHPEHLSVEYLHYYAKKRSGDRDDERAATLIGVKDAIRVDGQPNESVCPYQSDEPEQEKGDVGVLDIGQLWRCNLLWRGLGAGEVIKLIDDGKPLVLALRITDAFFCVGERGLVADGANARPVGNHAVLAVGYGKLLDGRRVLLIRNSWGVKWGMDGYAWLLESDVDAQLLAVGLISKLEADNENY